MSRSEPHNYPTYIIWQRPPEVHSVQWSSPLGLLQPPLLPQWILQEIITGLKRRKKQLDTGKPIIPIDVCITEHAFQLLEQMYGGHDNFVPMPRVLGEWLTAYLKVSSPWSEEHEQDFVVRCLKESDCKQVHVPWKPVRSLRKILKKAETEIVGERAKSSAPFELLFPSPEDRGAYEVAFCNLTEAHLGSEFFGIGGKTVFLPEHLRWWKKQGDARNPSPVNKKNYPLVDDKHVALVRIVFPADELNMLYVRHEGKHESWVYKGRDCPSHKTKIGGWCMVPRDGWMPLEAGNILLLGRLFKNANGKIQVMPGSLLLKYLGSET